MVEVAARESSGERSGLTVLTDVVSILSTSEDPRERLKRVFALLNAHGGLVRGAVVLLRRDTRELAVDAAHPPVDAEFEEESSSSAPRFDVDSGGLARQVIDTGQAVVLPQVRDSTGNLAFISVPIQWGDEVVGALSVDRRRVDGTPLEDDLQLYGLVAALLAPVVSARQTRVEAARPVSASPTRIVARAKSMKPVMQMIETVAASDATVLIRGESGTGKELVADAIHHLSGRRDQPFVKVNCAALAEGVLESELFGHEAGAFTGALQRRLGRFELANGGTIFLDEIGEFTPSIQVTLLRILQEQTFERVGGSQTLSTDVRVIAATNRDLEAAMIAERFRHDLYYRLNVFPIHVPPLRERRTDILLLADSFVERCARALNKDVRRISSEAIDLLMAYHWPGNVRELENCIERAVLLTRDGVIHAHHLPPTLQTPESSGTSPKGTLQSAVDAVERELIVDALKDARGNMAEAARRLGVTERQMGLRVKKYGLTPKKYRTGATAIR
ncbi:MAG: sigma 54-interacting transcriptional regulator [Myxococcota bacterium]